MVAVGQCCACRFRLGAGRRAGCGGRGGGRGGGPAAQRRRLAGGCGVPPAPPVRMRRPAVGRVGRQRAIRSFRCTPSVSGALCSRLRVAVRPVGVTDQERDRSSWMWSGVRPAEAGNTRRKGCPRSSCRDDTYGHAGRIASGRMKVTTQAGRTPPRPTSAGPGDRGPGGTPHPRHCTSSQLHRRPRARRHPTPTAWHTGSKRRQDRFRTVTEPFATGRSRRSCHLVSGESRRHTGDAQPHTGGREPPQARFSSVPGA